MLGKYLDALPPSALVRICKATGWFTHGYVDARGRRCLLGHAENWYQGDDGSIHCGAPELTALRAAAGDHLYNWPPLIGVRFDCLVERFSEARIVWCVKARASRHVKPHLSQAVSHLKVEYLP